MMRSPVQGGVKKRRTTTPRTSGNGDSTVIAYNVPSIQAGTVTGGVGKLFRRYIPGLTDNLANSVGPDMICSYSSAKFLPGTKIRWEPSVSFSTSGRVFVGFTDNPEVALQAEGLAIGAFATFVKGLGNVISFPVWQETEIPFPTRLRRKRFDTNLTVAASVDVYDRCMQTFMFAYIEGTPADTACGTFWYRDVVDVEGLHSIIT